MSDLINPYDLGDFQITENTQRININDLVSQALKELKLRLVEAQIEALGYSVSFTTSRTRFNGNRLWFICPFCSRRVGILYQQVTIKSLACKSCLGLKYKKQRFKDMIEANL